SRSAAWFMRASKVPTTSAVRMEWTSVSRSRQYTARSRTRDAGCAATAESSIDAPRFSAPAREGRSLVGAALFDNDRQMLHRVVHVSAEVPRRAQWLNATSRVGRSHAQVVRARLSLPDVAPRPPGIAGQRRAQCGLAPRHAAVRADLDPHDGTPTRPRAPSQRTATWRDEAHTRRQVRDARR